MLPSPEEIVAMLNSHLGGFNALIDLTFTAASLEEIVAQVEAGPKHTQPYGIVHGGVYSAIIETICSTGAALHAMPAGHSAVGLDNHTSFLRACRGGLLTARATPVHTGRRTHVWRADVTDDKGRLLATGQVRLMILEGGAQLAGETVGLTTTSE